MTGTAYMFAGLPGSGKSTAADILQAMTGGQLLRAGDMIREMARHDGIEDPTSEELGEYAARMREENGGGFFGERAVGMLLRDELPQDDPMIIDSVRHIDGVLEFREHFATSYLIWVEAPTRVRYDRIIQRGREDEGQFTPSELIQRDDREWTELGTQTIYDSDQVDFFIDNRGTKADLKAKLNEKVIGQEHLV